MDKRDLHETYLIAAALVFCSIIIGYNALSSVPFSKNVYLSPPAVTASNNEEDTLTSDVADNIQSLENDLFESTLQASSDSPKESNISSDTESVTTGIVNINTASASELSSALPGIGSTKAKAIVEYRETYGAFTSVDELINVSGIGEVTLEKIRAYCTV